MDWLLSDIYSIHWDRGEKKRAKGGKTERKRDTEKMGLHFLKTGMYPSYVHEILKVILPFVHLNKISIIFVSSYSAVASWDRLKV